MRVEWDGVSVWWCSGWSVLNICCMKLTGQSQSRRALFFASGENWSLNFQLWMTPAAIYHHVVKILYKGLLLGFFSYVGNGIYSSSLPYQRGLFCTCPSRWLLTRGNQAQRSIAAPRTVLQPIAPFSVIKGPGCDQNTKLFDFIVLKN